MAPDLFRQQVADLNDLVDTALFAAQTAVVNEHGFIVASNGTWGLAENCPLLEVLTGIPVGECLFTARSTMQDEIDGEYQRLLDGLRGILDGTLAAFRCECACASESSPRSFLISVTALPHTKEAVLSIFDLTVVHRARTTLDAEAQRIQAEQARLEALAMLDGLTGLKNFRALQEHLHREWERTQRYQSDLSLLLLDVDCFKAYNDAFGHLAGNRVLQHLADALSTAARDPDFVARYGGEEFAILLPNTDEAGAFAMAQRFQSALSNVAWPNRPVTVSIGLASWTPTVNGASADALRLFENADKALYLAKQSGRNTICQYSQIGPGSAETEDETE